MEEILLRCDSPCFSCPNFGRIIRIKNFKQRKLNGSYYCQHCDIYSLCKMGLAYKRHLNGELMPICTKCRRQLTRIILAYEDGQNHKPFNNNNLLIIREPNGDRFKILQTIKGSFFEDLAEVLLYILYLFGSKNYDIVKYDIFNKNFESIFSGLILEEKIIIKIVD